MQVAFLLLFYILSPFVILYLCHKYAFINKLGAVLMAYVVGIIIGNTGYFNGDAINQMQEIVMSVTIPLAIPLILYSSNLKKSFELAKSTFMSLLSALIALVVIVVLGYFIFKPIGNGNFSKISGLLVGVYTGGTPNLAALKMVLDVDVSTYLAIHTYDMVLSTLHLFFLMLIGKKMFELVLPKFVNQDNNIDDKWISEVAKDPYWGLLSKENRLPLLKAVGITFFIVAIGGGLMMLMPEKYQMAVFILSITALALVASTKDTIKDIPKTYELGMYLILIFSIVVASKADYRNFTNINPTIFYYVTFVVFGSMILHVLLAKIFKIDADTVIITSAALICSPPFVPVVAGALKNKALILPGITVGIVGYAIGNFLGFLISELLTLF
ncbi:DUF819 family protein [Saccharicrinis aurantiacus]|uniref:DUF819 family protein n=1 Tax=Saccharicrinis aurantiacus TaxID=1849719 RepID=UPI00249240D0|nr:DUF819 family protein [Saccharicrinis aurantiacus]